MEYHFTLNGLPFLISGTHAGFVWEHTSRYSSNRVIADDGPFATAAAAQADAMEYVRAIADDGIEGTKAAHQVDEYRDRSEAGAL